MLDFMYIWSFVPLLFSFFTILIYFSDDGFVLENILFGFSLIVIISFLIYFGLHNNDNFYKNCLENNGILSINKTYCKIDNSILKNGEIEYFLIINQK